MHLPGAAPRGAGVKAGSEGGGGDLPVGRARHPTERRPRRAATAAVGAGRGWSPERGTPRDEGSNGQRRRQRGPAGRSGAAPHGAKAKTGSEGGRGTGRSVWCGTSRGEGSNRRRRRRQGRGAGVGRARRLTGRGFKRAAKAGAGRAPRSPARPGRASRREEAAPRRRGRAARPRRRGWSYPLCRVCGRERAEAGAPCAPREHPDYIYQRVVSPETPADPSPITQSGQSEGRIRHLVPPPPLPGFRPPALRPSGRLKPPNTGPIRANQALRGPIRPRVRARESPECSRGAQGAPPNHHPAYSPRSGRGSGFRGGRPRRPGRRGHGDPAPREAAPGRPPPPRPHLRRHRRLEPRPRGAPHPTDRPVPLPPSLPA